MRDDYNDYSACKTIKRWLNTKVGQIKIKHRKKNQNKKNIAEKSSEQHHEASYSSIYDEMGSSFSWLDWMCVWWQALSPFTILRHS